MSLHSGEAFAPDRDTAAKNVNVLYIGGAGRSGSTLLGSILGQIDGFAYFGEFSVIWNRGLKENRLCGCGNHFRTCPIWNAVFDEAFGGIETLDPEHMSRLRDSVFNPLNLKSLFRALFATGEGQESSEFGSAVLATYQAAHSVSKSRLLVDSSHNPLYAAFLASLPGIKLHFVHLIRDSRAVVFSRQRQKYDPGQGKAIRTGTPLYAAGGWSLWNLVSEQLMRRLHEPGLRLHYEDLVANPQAAIRRILEYVNVEGAVLPFTDDHRVVIKPTHSVSGNPIRFNLGDITLREDFEWKTSIKLQDRLVTTLITWPLLLRYRYAI